MRLRNDFGGMTQVLGDATRQGIVVHDGRCHGIGNQAITNQGVKRVRRNGIELVLIFFKFRLDAFDFLDIRGVAHCLNQAQQTQKVTTNVRILSFDVLVRGEAVLGDVHAHLFHVLQCGSHEKVGATNVHELCRVLGILLCGAGTNSVINDVGVNCLKLFLIQVLEILFRHVYTLRNDLTDRFRRIHIARFDINHSTDDVGRVLHQALRFLRQRFDRAVAKGDRVFAKVLSMLGFTGGVLTLHEAIQAVAKLLDERQQEDHPRHVKERREDGEFIDTVIRSDAEHRSEHIDHPEVLVDTDNRDDAAQDLKEDVRGCNLLAFNVGIQRTDTGNDGTTETGANGDTDGVFVTDLAHTQCSHCHRQRSVRRLRDGGDTETDTRVEQEALHARHAVLANVDRFLKDFEAVLHPS